MSRSDTRSQFLARTALVSLIATWAMAAAAQTTQVPGGRVRVLGYGGTIAGIAEGAFKPDYEAGSRCLSELTTSLSESIGSDTCGGPPCITCSTDSENCSSQECKSTTCKMRLPGPPDGPNCSCEKPPRCYCDAVVRFCDIKHLDSSAMTPSDWLDIANEVTKVLAQDEADGVVITHGTDTLEETAYFLNLVLKTKKPVVLVAAMRAANHLSADGYMNLMNAIAVAAAPESTDKGVLVVVNDQIHAARDVTKHHTTNPATFHSPNSGPIGEVYFGQPRFYRLPVRKHTTRTVPTMADIAAVIREGKLGKEAQTEIIYDYAGNPGTTLKATIHSGIRGLVLAGTGNGNLGTEIKDLLPEAIEANMFVVRGSRTGSGDVTPNPSDLEQGLLTPDDLNVEKARVLLIVGLAATRHVTDRKDRLAMLRQFFKEY